VHVHTSHHRWKRARKKSGGGRIFVLCGYSASRISFQRIFGAINFFGGGQIRRLGDLVWSRVLYYAMLRIIIESYTWVPSQSEVLKTMSQGRVVPMSSLDSKSPMTKLDNKTWKLSITSKINPMVTCISSNWKPMKTLHLSLYVYNLGLHWPDQH